MLRKYSIFLLSLFTGVNGFSQLPVKPVRTISFTTDEGTNMNIDISPDGKTFVFDLLGDIYSLPVTGGKATQITRGIAINRCPIWSPDGKKIAYYSDISGALHMNIRDIKGSFHRALGRSEGTYGYAALTWPPPLWTPDGNFVAIGEYLYAIVGAKQILPHGGFLQISGNRKEAFYIDRNIVYRQDLSSHTKTPLGPAIEKYVLYSVLSPDARFLAYIADSGKQKSLFLRELTKGKDRVLIPSLFIKYPNYRDYQPYHYSFSHDSRTLYIAYGGKIHRIDIASGDDRIIPFCAQVRVDMGKLNYNTFPVTHDSLKVKYIRSVSKSPDGKHLVFTALNRIYIMDLPNGGPHVLSEQSNVQQQPVFSPDGKWVAYVSWSDTAGGSLWRVPVTGGQPEELTSVHAQYHQPTWSPDGSSIAVIKVALDQIDVNYNRIGRLELLSVNHDPVKVITDSAATWNSLAFSADGRSIMYVPGQKKLKDSTFRLVSQDLENGRPTALASGYLRMEWTTVEGRSFSPDGQYFTCSIGEDIYVVPVNTLCDPFPVFDIKQSSSLIRLSAGVDPVWENSGKQLSWTYGNNYYTISMEKVMKEATAIIEKNEISKSPVSYIVDVNIHPDRNISLPVSIPRQYAHGTLVLKNVRIITMQQDKIIEKGIIVIKNGRFAAVGNTGSVVIPQGAKVLDLAGATVMPGMIDMHAHMLRNTPEDVLPQQVSGYLADLAYGVTTVRDPSSTFSSFGYAELLETGQMIGPRLFSVGKAVDVDGGVISRLDNFEDAISIVDKRKLYGSNYIKQYMLPGRRVREWLLQASAMAGLNMTNEGDNDLTFQISKLKDGSTGIEHATGFGDVYSDVTRFMAKSGTYLTPTLQVRYGEDLARLNAYQAYWKVPDAKMKRFLPVEELQKIQNTKPEDTTNAGFNYHAQIYADIRHLGGLVSLGSHSEDFGTGVHNELWALQMGGLTNMEALQAATILGAKAMGMQKDLGSIEVGKMADLIILNKNPLEDIHNSREIRFVMKDGILYDADTLDEIWPEQKKCPDWKMKNIAK